MHERTFCLKHSRGGNVLLTSARVGVGYSIIDCRRWDATMTGLPACLHLTTISFCTEGTSSSGICAPACPSMLPCNDVIGYLQPYVALLEPGSVTRLRQMFKHAEQRGASDRAY